MSRRRNSAELQFGSDSFLDVVANIVGILIILIVIAGLRVSKIPVVPKVSASSSAPESNSDESISIDRLLAASADGDLSAETPKNLQAAEIVLEPIPDLTIPPELLKIVKQLENEIGDLESEKSKAHSEIEISSQSQTELEARLRALQTQTTQKEAELKSSLLQVSKVERDIELARQTLARLSHQLENMEPPPAHVETLQHRVTPLSRSVQGKEKHYRLSKNRVVEVPIDELVARFREQIERRKDWLTKTRHHEGQLGPIRGFTLHYMVQIESMSQMDMMKSGYGGYRINLAKWEVVPERDLSSETIEVALKKGSDFYQSILSTSPDTTLTFWVYPDSYGIYRDLQRFSHEHGFSVAGRPLPNGVNIAGSPNGSKSASQ